MHTPQSDPMPPTWVSQQAGHIPPPGTERKGHTQSSEDHRCSQGRVEVIIKSLYT